MIPNRSLPVPIKRTASSKLNSDTDPLELQGGDYTGRQNVEFNNDGEMFSDTPTYGNALQYDLGETETRNQTTRIFLDILFSRVFITLTNKNGQQLGYGLSGAVVSLQGNKDAIVDAFGDMVVSVDFGQQNTSAEYIDVTIDLGLSDFFLEILDIDSQPIRQTILYEAISYVAPFKEIGSVELNRNMFLFATTKDSLLDFIDKVGDLYRVGALIYVFNEGHGFTTNDSIVITNSINEGVVSNGEWTITVVNEDVFYLNASIAGDLPEIPAPYGGSIYTNAYSVGMIGVQTYNSNLDRYEFTKLIASKRFNFITSKQIDSTGEVNNEGYLIKYTDNYNDPRTFSFDGEFIENGALVVFNEQGIYTYDNLFDDIKNLVNYSQAEVFFEEQIQSGGGVPPANWRYGVRFLTESLSESEVSFLSQPIPTYSPAYQDIESIVYGNTVANDTTGKINRVRVTGIAAGRFRFIELIGYQYASSTANSTAVAAFRIRRVELSPEQIEIVLEHNGLETDIIFFDATDSNFVRPDIVRVGSNRLIDNRLVYGNITTTNSIDIREWVSGFKYSIKRFGLYGSFGAETFYEFFDPNATANYVGYQKYEWYRVYVAAEFISGKISDAVFGFDVRFVTQADYDVDEFATTNITDRRELVGDEFIDYSLGSGSSVNDGRNLYQLYLEVNNINWDFRIDGVSVSELFRSVKIMRAERVKEVIADGTIMLSVQAQDAPAPVLRDYSLSNIVPNLAGATEFDVIDYAEDFDTSTTTRRFCSFYSPDIIFGNDTYVYQDSDQIINFGSLSVASTQNYFNPYQNAWRIWKPINDGVSTPQIENIVTSVTTGTGTIGTIGGFTYTKDANIIGANNATNSLMYGSPILEIEEPLVNQNSFTDSGQYYGLIFRSKLNKYGDVNAIGNTVVYTGTTIYAGQSSGNVFGGDVFNQQLHFKHIRSKTSNSTSPARAFNIISSNIVNVNLRAFDPAEPTNAFPANQQDFTVWLATLTPADYTKNIGYSIFNNVQSNAVYDRNNKDKGLYPTRKYWSQTNPNNSQADRYREFLPLDFQDNPNVYGEITHLEVIQGELFTYQQKMFTREFFNATGRLTTSEDGSVNIGNGSVLSRDGLRNTARGTQHKWSVVKGFTDAGKDTVYWVDVSSASIMRFGSDGTQNLTERAMMKTFVRNNIRFVSDKFTPANNEGIHGVWDDIGKNYIVTCRAWKSTEDFDAEEAYKIGQVVIFGEEKGIPTLWFCILPTFNAAEGELPPDSPLYWRQIAFSDSDYYNVWTLVFNEQKNVFTHFYTFYPRIYHRNDNRYFSPNPILGNENKIYRHRDLGQQYIIFYDEDNEGFTEYVVNDYGTINKKFNALGYVSLLKPFRVEVFSQFISQNQGIDDRETFMERDNMEMRENVTFMQIRNNLDSDGRADQDTAPMRGVFARIKTFFKARESQKINDCTMNLRMGERNVKNT